MSNIEQYEHACIRIERAMREMNPAVEVRFQNEKRPAVVRFSFVDRSGQVVAASGDQSTSHILSLGKRQLRKLLQSFLQSQAV